MPSAIARNVVALNLAQAARLLGKVLSTLLLSRRLGLEGYGAFNYALSAAWTVPAFLDLGLATYPLKALARDPAWYSRCGGRFLLLQGALGLARGGLVVVLVPWICADPRAGALALPFALVPMSMVVTVDWLFLARDRTGALRNVALAVELLWLAVVVLFAHSSADLPRLAGLYTVTRLMEAGSLFGLAWFTHERPGFSADTQSVSAVLRQTLPYWLTQTVTHWRAQLGLLLLGRTFGTRAVGAFDLAWKVAHNLWLIGFLGATAVRSAIYRAAVSSSEALHAIVARTLRNLWALGLCAAAGVIVLAPRLAGLLSPTDTDIIARAIRWLAPTALVLVLRGVLDDLCFAQHRTRVLVGLVLLNVAWLAPLYVGTVQAGTDGLAVALLVSELLSLGTLAWTLGLVREAAHSLRRPGSLALVIAATLTAWLAGSWGTWLAGALSAVALSAALILFAPAVWRDVRSLVSRRQAAAAPPAVS